MPFLLAFLSRQAQPESCKGHGVGICAASIFIIAILNVMWLSMVLIESTFLGCLFARDGDKSHQKNRKIQIWKWDIEMETLNSSGDIIEVPHANQTSSFALHYGLLIVIPAHATKDVQRRAAQRESWQMLLQNDVSCNSCRSARTVRCWKWWRWSNSSRRSFEIWRHGYCERGFLRATTQIAQGRLDWAFVQQ